MTNPRWTGRSVAELREHAAMMADVITEGTSPEIPRYREWIAEIETLIAFRTGHAPMAQDTAAPASDLTEIGRRAGSAASNQFGTFQVHAASPAQIRFIRKLITDRDWESVDSPKLGKITIPADLDAISKKSATALIDRLMAAPKRTTGATLAAANGPSEKQVALIKKLLGEKDVTGFVFNPESGVELDTPDAWLAYLPKLTPGRTGTASKLIDALFKAPRKPVVKAEAIPAGAYLVDGRVIRVYLGQQSGRMLAAELVDATARNRDDAWQYLGQADRFVKVTDHRMTVAECEALAAGNTEHGWCCVCGHALDDPNSVGRGIGPVCRAKQGGI